MNQVATSVLPDCLGGLRIWYTMRILSRNRKTACLSAGLFFLAIFFVHLSSRPNTGSSRTTEPAAIKYLAKIDPDPIEFGFLRPGECAGLKASITNNLDNELVVERFQTSCPCVQIRMDDELPAILGPKDVRAITIEFDPKDEPDFRGGLSVQLLVWSSDARCACRARVLVTVTREPPA